MQNARAILPGRGKEDCGSDRSWTQRARPSLGATTVDGLITYPSYENIGKEGAAPTLGIDTHRYEGTLKIVPANRPTWLGP